MIKTNSPAATGTKYMSATEAGAIVDTGVGVADASRTAMYVESEEGPYALDPAKLAIIWYEPGTSGVNSMPYFPWMSLVTVSMGI